MVTVNKELGKAVIFGGTMALRLERMIERVRRVYIMQIFIFLMMLIVLIITLFRR